MVRKGGREGKTGIEGLSLLRRMLGSDGFSSSSLSGRRAAAAVAVVVVVAVVMVVAEVEAGTSVFAIKTSFTLAQLQCYENHPAQSCSRNITNRVFQTHLILFYLSTE